MPLAKTRIADIILPNNWKTRGVPGLMRAEGPAESFEKVKILVMRP